MPAVSTITIADSVPANRSYAPMLVELGNTTWIDRTTESSIAAQSTAVVQFSPATAKRNTDRITVRLNLPKKVVVNGVDTVDSVARFVGEFVVPGSWVTLDRANLHKLVANLLATSVVQAVVKDRDPAY